MMEKLAPVLDYFLKDCLLPHTLLFLDTAPLDNGATLILVEERYRPPGEGRTLRTRPLAALTGRRYCGRPGVCLEVGRDLFSVEEADLVRVLAIVRTMLRNCGADPDRHSPLIVYRVTGGPVTRLERIDWADLRPDG